MTTRELIARLIELSFSVGNAEVVVSVRGEIYEEENVKIVGVFSSDEKIKIHVEGA